MSRLLPLLLCLLALPSFAGEERPSRADLQRVMELHARSVVRVRGPRQTGPGVIVGAAGQVLTSVESVGEEFVGLNAATVEHDGKSLPARVVLANAALKVALVAAPDGTYPAVPVRLLKEGDSLAGRWVVGVVPGTKGQPARPVSAQASGNAPEPFYDVPLALPPGSPVFDADGRLVAVVVQRHKRGCRVLPLGAVKVQLAAADTP
ncbi:trypsin-like peptidase domain-containing protein [Pyxidicoccus trucidator]|uniref:MXAN_2756 family trypsin-like serine endoprotease n=1 Tax=Pyxidicoccus trucidator TaxID=2709662 RepID=UPI0013DB44FE|nr:trypsin-like peptidase domain-containing protein [Pyxidicoccus trucidator]